MRFTSYGKMSLTNYIGQSVIGSLLFYHWGFELGRFTGITYSFFLASFLYFFKWHSVPRGSATSNTAPLKVYGNALHGLETINGSKL